MTHEEIHSREIPEAYVRRRLSGPEREAFEDHYFGCEECFEQVQTLRQFVDGVRDAAESGRLPDVRSHSFSPLTLLAFAASVILATIAGWALLIERPRLQADAAASRARVSAIEKNLAEMAMARVPDHEANLPIVMLEATRANTASSVSLAAGADQLALWVEPPPAPAGAEYRLEIHAAVGQPAQVITGLKRNTYGALAVSIPAKPLSPGSYRARLYLGKNLAGEYRFEVRR